MKSLVKVLVPAFSLDGEISEYEYSVDSLTFTFPNIWSNPFSNLFALFDSSSQVRLSSSPGLEENTPGTTLATSELLTSSYE